jgi:NTE family protein
MPSWRDRLHLRRGTARRDTIAFVLSGGGTLGAIQVGMLRALFEADIRPGLVLGCSVGAMNGAVVAQEPNLTGVARLEDLWRGLAETKDLLPAAWLSNTVALARRGEAIHDNAAIRRVVEGVVTAATFEDLALPFQCIATDMAGVREVWFSTGPLVDAILASAAIPSVFPGVEIDGVRYHDGAVLNDVPMTRAVELGARTVFVLQTGAFDRPRPEPRRPLDVAIQAYWVARHHRFKRDLAAMPPDVDVILLPTGQPPVTRFNDLSRSSELITTARDATRAFLEQRDETTVAPTAVAYGVEDLEPRSDAPLS